MNQDGVIRDNSDSISKISNSNYGGKTMLLNIQDTIHSKRSNFFTSIQTILKSLNHEVINKITHLDL